jgi:hypothetical protein
MKVSSKPDKQRPLERLIHRWENNIKMNLEETGCKVWTGVYVAHDKEQYLAPMNTVLNFLVS